jgi:threonyl-tRNA synthetase
MDEEKLVVMRHSLAHIMAAAVQKLWPEAKFGVGPAIENGFYYDIDFGGAKVGVDDFPKIEKAMRQIIAENQKFIKSDKTLAEAIQWAKDNHQPYKQELLENLQQFGTTNAKEIAAMKSKKSSNIYDKNEVKTATFYTNGDFTDLCRGPHVESTSEIPADAFKLTRTAGAYWRGDETQPMMTRIYGVAFTSKNELKKFLQRQEEAKLRDHRRLGRELDLYIMSDLVGAGLPLFTPRGTVLRDELGRYSNELRQKIGFQKVWTPQLTKKDLYEKSGHWAKFGDELFLVKSQETKDQFVLKPMNCPHHTRIYASQPRSWRDLPIRYLETTTDYRDEKSGELGGLSRVRSLTQDDSHVFCRPDQIQTEIRSLMNAAAELYKTVGMPLRVRLSYRDGSDSYLGSQSLWDNAQKQLKAAVIEAGLDYFEQTGEAAFYGPKIDFMARDALDREHQVATVQLDFVQPERFELEYSGEGGQPERPVMIHCALLGSIERFLSVYIEHTGGRFPVWCAPEQLRLIKVKDDDDAVNKLCDDVMKLAFEAGVRASVDDSKNSVGKKIRTAEVMKVPYSVVIGEKEAKSGQLPLRVRSDLMVVHPPKTYAPEQLVRSIANEAKQRASKSSL